MTNNNPQNRPMRVPISLISHSLSVGHMYDQSIDYIHFDHRRSTVYMMYVVMVLS